MSKCNSKEKNFSFNDFKRTRYFHGMLMTDRDFREEQIYHNKKRKLLNRMLHGWGVVCGLKVKATNPQGPNIIVEPGMAIDCLGNEILVCEEQTIGLTTNPCQPAKIEDKCAQYRESVRTDNTLYVVIRFDERKTDPVPVYIPSGGCDENVCDYSRTQEGFCIEVWDHEPPRPDSRDDHGGQLCTIPFPCPGACPEPHYILLAKISCGARFDAIFSRADQYSKVYYTVKRWLDKVCLTSQDTDGVEITETLSVEGISSENVSVSWEFDSSKLQMLELVGFPTEPHTGQTITIPYKVKTNASAGLAHLNIPVTLTISSSASSSGGRETKFVLTPLDSPIEIGVSDVKRGSLISTAMIRNVANRKYVASFPWFDWLFRGMKQFEDFPWSGDAWNRCGGMDILPVASPPVRPPEKVLDEMKTELRKEMEAGLAEIRKTNEDNNKEVLNKYEERINELQELIKKIQEGK